MISLLLGMAFLLAVGFAAFRAEPLELHPPVASVLLVVGGSFSVLWLSVPWTGLRNVFLSLWDLFKTEEEFASLRRQLEPMLQNRSAAAGSNHPLIAYAQELWEQGISPELFIVLISQKRKELETRSLDAIQSLKNLAKYPPAFGMIATVMGMVSLFSTLDNNKAGIGMALSLAMTSTLLGLVLTNALISPLADRLQIKQLRAQRTYEGVYQILLLINNGEPPALIRDEVQLRAA